MIRQWLAICLGFVLTFFNSPLVAQKSTYTITAAGKHLGEINTLLIKEGGLETYTVVSEVDFKVLWTHYNRKTDNIATFKKGLLVKSHSSVYMDQVLEDSSAMYFDKDKYHCFRSPDQQFVLDAEEIRFTTVMLYYREPVGIDKIYSERFLDYSPMEKLDAHTYRIYLPNGKQNEYTYVDGILTEVFVDRTWFNLRFKRQ